MKKTIYLLIICFIFILESVQSQSPYHLNWKRELSYTGSGALVMGAGRYFKSNVKSLSVTDLNRMNRKYVLGFDRSATFQSSAVCADWSDRFLLGSFALPTLFLANKTTRGDFGKIAVMYGEVFLFTSGLTYLSKGLVQRPRPYVYNETFDDGSKLSQSARFSFFSGHTAETAANCFFVAKVFADYFPDSKWKPVVWGVAATIPAATGYFRYAAGKHYPSDILVGYAVGAFVGVMIPQWHKKPGRKADLSFYPGMGGGTMILRF